MNVDTRIELGRGALGVAEYGEPSGAPMLVFHGFPGTRQMALVLDEPARKLGVRVIGIDRPGFGRSDYRAGRQIRDWPADAAAVADALGLGEFAIMGISGGGPYAAACARFIPERLTHTAIVCGSGPLDAPDAKRGMSRQNRLLFSVARYAPFLVGLSLAPMLRRAAADPHRFIEQMKASMPEADRRALESPGAIEIMTAGADEENPNLRRAISQEAGLFARPWGFELSEISVPVHLYQGEQDRNVPPTMGRYLAATIPNCVPHFFPDAGHLSLVMDHREECLRAMLNSLDTA